MKSHYILMGLLLCGIASSTAFAQEVDIVGRLRFTSPRVTQVQNLYYGVGNRYTDSTDRDFEELIPPFPPPGGYLIVLDRECSSIDGDPPCYWKQDLRGLPDSIVEEENRQFSLEYDILVVDNATGAGLTLSILPPDWSANVDSIHLVDVQLPRAFNHTFTGPGDAEITDEFTKYIKATVYYNLNVSSVNSGSESKGMQAGLNISPNPTGENEVVVRSSFNSGDRVTVTDMLGQVVTEVTVGEILEGVRIKTEGIPAGNYVVARLNENGEIVARDLLRIVR